MSIKIMIERKFKKKPSLEIFEAIDEIRIKALRNRGYIGGETMVNADDKREVLVISAWSSVDGWKTWYDTKEWKEFEKHLAPHLDGPVKVRIFMPGADFVKESFRKMNWDSDLSLFGITFLLDTGPIGIARFGREFEKS